MHKSLSVKEIVIICAGIGAIIAVAIVLTLFLRSGLNGDSNMGDAQPTEFVYVPVENKDTVNPAETPIPTPNITPIPTETPEPKPTTGVAFYDAPREQHSITDVWKPENTSTPAPDYTIPETVATIEVDETPEPINNEVANVYSAISPQGYMFEWEDENHLIGQIRSYVMDTVYAPLETLPEFIDSGEVSVVSEALMLSLSRIYSLTEVINYAFNGTERQSVWNELSVLLDDMYDTIYSARLNNKWENVTESENYNSIIALKHAFSDSFR